MPELRFLTALPVFNEASHVNDVLNKVSQYATDILVVDDGSSDGTSKLLAKRTDIWIATHSQNRGYGAALITAFKYAIQHRYDVLVTIDCDGQHEPQLIKDLAYQCVGVDIVSGSRYYDPVAADAAVPVDRRKINHTITAELNQLLNVKLTDTFCGFKAYRTTALAKLDLQETGYAMPLELWVQAAYLGLKIKEVPVPLIYLEEERSFGGNLDQADIRLKYYRKVITKAQKYAAVALSRNNFPSPAGCGSQSSDSCCC